MEVIVLEGMIGELSKLFMHLLNVRSYCNLLVEVLQETDGAVISVPGIIP